MPALPKRAETPPVILASSPPRPRKPPSPLSSLELYAAIGGGALALGGTVVYLFAYQKFESAKHACNQGSGCPYYDARFSTVTTLRDIAIGAWIAGGAALATSVVHFKYRTRKRSLEVAIDPANGRLLLRGAF